MQVTRVARRAGRGAVASQESSSLSIQSKLNPIAKLPPMRISIEHITRYRYGSEATYAIQSLRLTPSSFDGQRVIAWSVEGKPCDGMTATVDGFGNALHLL